MNIKLLFLIIISTSNLFAENLNERCQDVKNKNCCLASAREIKINKFLLSEDGDCPAGHTISQFRCPDSLRWCEPDACLGLGATGGFGGVPGPDGWPPAGCCPGLEDRATPHSCDRKLVGGYSYICISCGDSHCDKRYENHCNCPEDCS